MAGFLCSFSPQGGLRAYVRIGGGGRKSAQEPDKVDSEKSKAKDGLVESRGNGGGRMCTSLSYMPFLFFFLDIYTIMASVQGH